MPISSVVITSTDVARSVEFYRRFLGAELIGEADDGKADLDLVAGTVRVVRAAADPPASNWEDDDRQRGFRHVGFKVDRLEPWTVPMREAGVRFHIEPCDTVGGLRIAFFYDPDGTLLEFVEGNAEYAQVLDEEAVASERALDVPSRPRFDHVAMTVADVPGAIARYEPLGFVPFGTLEFPGDERGLHITDLRSGDTVLELFEFSDPTRAREPQVGYPGFQFAVLADACLGEAFARSCTTADGTVLHADPEGLLLATTATLPDGSPHRPD
jgi:catechol 2,3-dioxygenase-like lactoylglutathione lyase family enzyme